MTRKKVSFEQALSRLEEIVGRLESSEISLEESMKTFEEGKELVKLCLQKLDEAEQKIKKLQKNEQGDFQLSDL